MSILRWRQVLLVAVLLLAAVLLVRSQPAPAASTPTPAAVTSQAVADPVLVDVATRFLVAYQAGSHAGTGGRVWLDMLAPVTTPELLAAVEFVDPDTISVAPIATVTTSTGAALVVLTDGTAWWLTITNGRVALVERG